jgi:hypothetical protein
MSQLFLQSRTGICCSWDANDNTPRVREAMNWTEILKRGGVPEPPGYQETLERLRQNPYKERQAAREEQRKAKKRKAKPALNSRHGKKAH